MCTPCSKHALPSCSPRPIISVRFWSIRNGGVGLTVPPDLSDPDTHICDRRLFPTRPIACASCVLITRPNCGSQPLQLCWHRSSDGQLIKPALNHPALVPFTDSHNEKCSPGWPWEREEIMGGKGNRQTVRLHWWEVEEDAWLKRLCSAPLILIPQD